MRFNDLKKGMILRRPIGYPVHHLFFIKLIEGEVVKMDIYARSDKTNPFEVQYGSERNSDQWNNYKFRFHNSELADEKDFQEFIKGAFESIKIDVMK